MTVSYLSLRKLENECLKIIAGNSSVINLGDQSDVRVKVKIQNFYGIEINDFAVSVARTAMWIAESQMWDESQNIVYSKEDFLPLDSNDSIYEGNALRMDWSNIVKPYELNYIMGNPPFIGARMMSSDQKKDINALFDGIKGKGNLDYVAGWYLLAAKYIQDTTVSVGFVSTNSITQGEQVPILWQTLFSKYHVIINSAYRTFVWNNEAKTKASVHCVIICFSLKNKDNKNIYDGGDVKNVNHINGYLIDGKDIAITNRTKPISKNVPEARSGNQPIDNGNYLFTKSEYMIFVAKYPKAKALFRRWIGSREFINNIDRYCLWLGDSNPSLYRNNLEIMKRIQNVKEYRLSSKRKSTLKLADYPTHFQVETIEHNNYLVMPLTSSQRREYVPIGFISPDALPSNLVTVISNASLSDFAVITSSTFMDWMKTICGRLKSDYRITKNNVYNNFPWPKIENEQKEKLSKTAQGILDARKLYPDSSLADLYDPLTMPVELRKAHEANDKAVLKAYGLKPSTTEQEIVQYLFEMYEKLTSKEK